MAGFFKRRLSKAKNTLSDWMGIGIAVGTFDFVKGIFVSVFLPGKGGKGPKETFEEAIARMNLTEADLKDRQKMFLMQTFVYLGVGLCVLGYAIWLAFQGYITGMLVTFLVALLAFSYAFRSHFWLFQLKKRKLGCTFKEYLDSSL